MKDLTTVAAHKTMNLLDVNKNKKKNIVDTISAVYILETYLNKIKVNCKLKNINVYRKEGLKNGKRRS